MNDMRDVELNAIGVLKRREIEARILAPVVEALGREFGRERGLQIAADNCGDREGSGQAIGADQWGQQPPTIRCGSSNLDQGRCAGDRGARPERK